MSFFVDKDTGIRRVSGAGQAFNLRFGRLQLVKKETMSFINEKISRIRAILKELGLNNEDVPAPQLLPNEVPDSVLAVKEKLIIFEEDL